MVYKAIVRKNYLKPIWYQIPLTTGTIQKLNNSIGWLSIDLKT